jgi:predicted nuclease with RNAse H fold
MRGLHQHPNSTAAQGMAVIGIDVGGQRKGFHAVALRDGRYSGRYATCDVAQLVDWCRQVEGVVIAVDAPCRWSKDGRARPAERKLMAKGIWCFSTPTRQRATAHPKNHYGWMLRGEELFEALASSHPICANLPALGENCCIETFPHAVTWHLTGGKANASKKRTQRRSLLTEAGIDLAALTNIDLVDAAICALTAHCVASGGEYVSYGEADTGYIIVPAGLNHE